jgi:signal transduction histidine kinase
VQLVDTVRTADPDAAELWLGDAMLHGLATWAAAVARPWGTVLVGGADDLDLPGQPLAAAGLDGHRVVVAAADSMVLAAVAGADAAGVCSGSPAAVEAVVKALADGGAGEGQRPDLEAIRDTLQDAAPADVAPLVDALAAAVRTDRRATASRIHDGPVQELTAAQLLLDSATWGAQLPASVNDPLQQGISALRSAIGGCRAIMAWLSTPPGSDESDVGH